MLDMCVCPYIPAACNELGDASHLAPPCPCPHDRGTRPCTCVQGPKNYFTKNCTCGVSTGCAHEHNRVHELHLGISTDCTQNCNCGNSAVVCTSRPAPVVAPRRACPNPCRRTATAESPLLSAMLDQGTRVAQQRACQARHAQQEHRPLDNVLQVGNLCGLLKSRTMGICLCRMKGTSKTFT